MNGFLCVHHTWISMYGILCQKVLCRDIELADFSLLENFLDKLSLYLVFLTDRDEIYAAAAGKRAFA
jgi:hypothetical protein